MARVHRVPVEIWVANVRARSACVGVAIFTSYSGSGATPDGRACASSLTVLPAGRPATSAARNWNPSNRRLYVLIDRVKHLPRPRLSPFKRWTVSVWHSLLDGGACANIHRQHGVYRERCSPDAAPARCNE